MSLSLHPLIPVFLLLIYDGVDGMQIKNLSRRRGGDGRGGDGGSSGGDDHPSSSNQSPISTTHISLSVPQTTPQAMTNTSFNNNTSTSLPSSTSSPLPAFASFSVPQTTPQTMTNTSFNTSSTSSPLPASTSNSQVRLAEARHIGTIVGAVLGSVILASLSLMILAKYLGRARKARKRPRGFLSSTYFTDKSPQTEMSQTQNGPLLISSAPLAHHPVPMQFFNASSRNDTSSLSPLFSAATFHNSQDTANSSRRRLSTSESDGSSHAPGDPLQPPYDMRPSLSLQLPLPVRAVLAEPASSSGQLLPLHRDMVEFQKALEADHKGEVSNPSAIIGDPPPKYAD